MLVVGLSHQTAGLAAREQIALDDSRARAVLHGLRADGAVHEAVVLSTCNRTEIYAVAEDPREGERAVRRALLDATSVGAATLAGSGYALFDLDAAEHLFRVAAGLESAILGETEIGGQVRCAAGRAELERMLGPVLAGAFEHAALAARRVRRRTRVSAGATSVASVVAGLVAGAGPAAARRRIVLLGAGRLARSLSGALAAVPGAELVIVNRTLATARELAARHGALAGSLECLGRELERADALVCATDAAHPLVSAAAIRRALRSGRRPLLIVDLAVPRDVEPSAAALPGVTAYDIDAVQGLVNRNLAMRRREADRAADMLRGELARFAAWRRELSVAPVVGSVWREAERMRREELARVAGALTPAEQERLDRLTASLVGKLLHGPCERLRAACAEPDGGAHVESFRMLFGVGAGEPPNVIPMPQQGAA